MPTRSLFFCPYDILTVLTYPFISEYGKLPQGQRQINPPLPHRIPQKTGKLAAGREQHAAYLLFFLRGEGAAADADGADWTVGEVHDNGAHAEYMVFIFLTVKGVSALAGQSDILQEQLQVSQCILCQGLDVHLVPLFYDFPIGISG